MSTRAFFLTILELFCIVVVFAPLIPQVTDLLERAHVGFDFRVVASWAKSIGLDFLRRPFYGLAKSYNDSVRWFVGAYGLSALQGVGGVFFLWNQLVQPGKFHRMAQYANLTGRVLEVRRDMSLKISLGENRGVEVGMAFVVQKKKHMDALSQLNFKTMIMAPQVFPIGRATVVSTTPTFSICKFKRSAGQSSSPSPNDRVAILKQS
jgi:hypothetical protein